MSWQKLLGYALLTQPIKLPGAFPKALSAGQRGARDEVEWRNSEGLAES